jgi:hypothetical protein
LSYKRLSFVLFCGPRLLPPKSFAGFIKPDHC